MDHDAPSNIPKQSLVPWYLVAQILLSPSLATNYNLSVYTLWVSYLTFGYV